jgi:hypothetical protein
MVWKWMVCWLAAMMAGRLVVELVEKWVVVKVARTVDCSAD